MTSPGVTRGPVELLADPSRVLGRLFVPGHAASGERASRASHTVAHVLALSGAEVTAVLDVLAAVGGDRDDPDPSTRSTPTMPETTAPHRPTELTQRRCWRCLQQFTTDPPVPVREDFWLCDPCDASLLPSKRRAS